MSEPITFNSAAEAIGLPIMSSSYLALNPNGLAIAFLAFANDLVEANMDSVVD